MDILSHFQFEDAGRRLEDIETPVPIVDIDIVARNLNRWQQRCDKAGFANRPHFKTHKLVPLARHQLALGASGLTVQKLGEAEVLADAGVRDLLLTFNVVGRHKLERLAAVARKSDIKVVADSPAVVEGLSHAGGLAGREIEVLVECGTGGQRNGVQSPVEAVTLAKTIATTPGLRYGGLMTYPKAGSRLATQDFLAATCDLARQAGLETRSVSSGGSPDMWKDEGLDRITEYRAGTYAYFDRSMAVRGTCIFEDCALTVLATVVSRPTGDRALIDAGSKALTSDLLGLSGYGVVRELGLAPVYNLSEEHGFLDVSGVADKPRVGDLVRVTPNHVCPVSNLFDKVVIVRGNEVIGAVRVDARGMVQ